MTGKLSVQSFSYHTASNGRKEAISYYRWISWHILPWELEGITSPCCLLIGQYPHHMTLCPPVALVKRCFGIRLHK